MYVLQFYLNLFSVVLAQLRLTLRCRCIDASTSTVHPLTSLHLHLHTLTSADLPLHLTTPTHLRIYISHLYIHTVAPSHLSCLPFFLHIFSLVSVHLHLRTLKSTDLPLHLHTSTDLYRACTSTLTLLHIHPLFLSFYTSFRQCWTIACLALGPTVV